MADFTYLSDKDVDAIRRSAFRDGIGVGLMIGGAFFVAYSYWMASGWPLP